MQKLKVFFLKNITWIYTLEYIAFSIVLLFVVSLIDLRILPIKDFLPDIIKLRVDFSQGILTSLAAAFLTITTFTFSTILTVLNTYASSFTPRVVENFINRKITLKVVGIFIGGFFYCIGSLIFTREVLHNEAVISGFVAIIYSIICIIYFIIFVQEVITKFQGVNVILDVADMAQKVIDEEVAIRKQSQAIQRKEHYVTHQIQAKQSGYFSLVDLDAILSMMKDQEGYLSIDCKIGQYVAKGMDIATVSLKDVFEEELEEKILDTFVFQDQKLAATDYRYNITKLLEIALRAISPGINDPNTAIHCINKLGVLLSPMASIDTYHIQKAENRQFRIYYSSYGFQDDLETFYLPLMQYGKEDLQVVVAILQSLTLLYQNATQINQRHIQTVIQHLEEKIKPCFTTSLESSILLQHLQGFKDTSQEG